MYQPIADCYEGQSIFLTGGTGFLGKVLVEKLLYSCPGIDKIYILIREKQNVSAEKRLQKMFDLPLFTRIKNENPETLQKVIPIIGDVSMPELGISGDDRELLINTVSRVFHLAATIKFNEALDVAVNINVDGTRHVLSFCQTMKHIKSFVYVSTAFSNSDKKLIEEKIYPATITLSELKKLIDIGLNENQIQELIGDKPNIYTFTKAIAENVIQETHGNVPVAIVRPSIVSSSQSEPVPGWIDNWYGATGLIAAGGKGFNRVIHTTPNNILDLIPVDYVANAIVVVAARCKWSKDVAVYNSCSSGINPLQMQKLGHLTMAYTYKHKMYDIPLPFVYFTSSKLIAFLITLFLEIIPAHLADVYLILTGKKRRYVKALDTLYLVRKKLQFFISKNFIIKSQKTCDLAESLSTSDKCKFPLNPSKINWDDYIPIYCHGIRQFLLKEK